MYDSISLPLDAVCSSTGSTWQVIAITNVVFACICCMHADVKTVFFMKNWFVSDVVFPFGFASGGDCSMMSIRFLSSFPNLILLYFRAHWISPQMSEVMCLRWGTVSVHHFVKKMHDSLPDWVKDCLGSKATVKGFPSKCSFCLTVLWHKSSAMSPIS